MWVICILVWYSQPLTSIFLRYFQKSRKSVSKYPSASLLYDPGTGLDEAGLKLEIHYYYKPQNYVEVGPLLWAYLEFFVLMWKWQNLDWSDQLSWDNLLENPLSTLCSALRVRERRRFHSGCSMWDIQE